MLLRHGSELSYHTVAKFCHSLLRHGLWNYDYDNVLYAAITIRQ